jgi:rSAM/selenodomain-associated transferase 1
MKSAIGVMARAPSSPGKTRLAASVSEPHLRALRAAMLADTVAVASAVPRADVVVFVTPAESGAEIVSLLPQRVAVRPQCGADLGERMRHAIAELIDDDGCDAAILVGTDAPLVTTEHFAEALGVLHTRGGVVIGPADDGGYYLIGMTRVFADLFTGVTWGSDSVLLDTMRIAEHLRIEACLIRGAYDIDTIADLRRLERDLALEPPSVAPRTRQALSAAV